MYAGMRVEDLERGRRPQGRWAAAGWVGSQIPKRIPWLQAFRGLLRPKPEPRLLAYLSTCDPVHDLARAVLVYELARAVVVYVCMLGG